MKKLLSFLILFSALQVCAQATWRFSVINTKSDTAVAGSSFFIDLKQESTFYLYNATDSIKVFIGHSYFDEGTAPNVVKIQKQQWGGGGCCYGVNQSAGVARFTFNLPSNFRGMFYFYCFGAVEKQDSVYITSPTPDMDIYFLDDDANPGDFINYDFTWTYQYAITDSVKIKIAGITQKTVAVKDIVNNNIEFAVNAPYGVTTISFSGALTYSQAFTVTGAPPVTSILVPFTESSRKDILYYDILGRPVIPQIGDLIKYSDFSAIVIR